MPDEEIVYTYEPQEGLFVSGVPQRDLTQADVDALGPAVYEAVATGLYRKAVAKKPEKPLKPDEDG